MHIGEAEIAALKTVRELQMIEAEEVQNGRVEIVHVDFVLRRVEAKFVRFAER